MRRISYVTGTRADFGLMAGTLRLIQAHPGLELSLIVTGMHLSKVHGETVKEIEAGGFPIAARVPSDVESSTRASMAIGVGQMLIGITRALEQERPDLVLLLGDRGEMLAGAIAALHLNLPIAHIHGGELSGTVDEPVRHAISKLSHLHFVSTPGARERLVRMGERPEHIFVTGAPGLDGLQAQASRPRAALCAEVGFDPARPVALLVYHPVVQQAEQEGEHVRVVLDAVLGTGAQVLCLMPNADAGGQLVRAALTAYEGREGLRLVTHLARADYLSWMAAADVLVGNSSSGIIEAASLGLRVVNVGERQHGRERSGNVVDVPVAGEVIGRTVASCFGRGRWEGENVYGDGGAGERIVGLLAEVGLTAGLLAKSNAY